MYKLSAVFVCLVIFIRLSIYRSVFDWGHQYSQHRLYLDNNLAVYTSQRVQDPIDMRNLVSIPYQANLPDIGFYSEKSSFLPICSVLPGKNRTEPTVYCQRTDSSIVNLVWNLTFEHCDAGFTTFYFDSSQYSIPRGGRRIVGTNYYSGWCCLCCHLSRFILILLSLLKSFSLLSNVKRRRYGKFSVGLPRTVGLDSDGILSSTNTRRYQYTIRYRINKATSNNGRAFPTNKLGNFS